MKRCLTPLLAVLLLGLATGSDSPREDDDRATIDDLEGSWQLLAVEHDGKNVNNITWVLAFHNGKYTRKDSNGSGGTGDYSFGTKQNLPHLDLRPDPKSNYATTIAIVQFQGDTLKMAWTSTLTERPKSFQDKGIYLGTFKRVK